MKPLACLFVLLGVTVAWPCSAQPLPEATRVEARARFDRGLSLFNQSDSEGALAEFRRAYELVPHPRVLYNIGLVHAALGQSVEAVAAFDRLLAEPASLEPEELEHARRERARHAARIAKITVRTEIAGAVVEVDGVRRGLTPLPGPLEVASGMRVVSLIAPGFAPVREVLTVAGETEHVVQPELVPLNAALAHLRVSVDVPDVEVLIDGEVVGRTPLPASLALAPGRHDIVLQRAGYRTLHRTLDLGAGATGELDLELELDERALVHESGYLSLVLSAPDAVVWLDGRSFGTPRAALRLPAGQHRLRVERSGFIPVERSVEVPLRSSAELEIALEPNADERARYRSRVNRQRTWAFIGLGAGAALAAGGATFLAINQGTKNDAKQDFEAQAARHETGGDCDPTGVRDASCVKALDLSLQRLRDARGHDVYGWLGIGVGAAALGTGAVLLLTADDPDRYELSPESDVFGSVGLNVGLGAASVVFGRQF